jgi:hypothetical protein
MNFFPESDELADLIAAPIDTTRKVADLTAGGFTEVCPKCRGTGRFVGWSGRSLGQCFTCQGAGNRTFKTSTAQRADNRTKAAARAERKAQEALEAFRAAHPVLWNWMDGSTFEFAVSLRAALEKYGSLTEKQLGAAYRCVEKLHDAKEARAQADAARAESAPTVSSERLLEAFQTALANGLKFPKLRLGGLVITKAKDSSSNPGALYVKADGEYVGKVVSGRFMCTRECPSDVQGTVVSVINDPAAAAKASGLATGSCSCCGRELTDPESVAAGIGPVCANKWGF